MNQDDTETAPEMLSMPPQDPAQPGESMAVSDNGQVVEPAGQAPQGETVAEGESTVPDMDISEPGTGSETDPMEVNAENANLEAIPAVTEPEPALVAEAPRKEYHVFKTLTACFAGALIPGLGHAVLGKWDRAVVFMGSIVAMFAFGLYLNGRLFGPDFSDLFTILKFVADAGIGLIYWLAWHRQMGAGDPSVYTYDFANVFIYAAGLLNMLVIVDAFDIAQGEEAVNNHFLLMAIFSFTVSLVFTFLNKHGARARTRYFLCLFGSFVFFSILAGWIMWVFPF